VSSEVPATCLGRVQYLVEQVPAARDNDKLLILLYWQIFDEIAIPPAVVRAVLTSGAQPDSITRLKRRHILESQSSVSLDEQIRQFMEATK
jgi:hypothetical protein